MRCVRRHRRRHQLHPGPERSPARGAALGQPHLRPTADVALRTGSWPDFWVRFSIDGWANGPGLDHRVFVYPAETGGGYVVEVRRSDETVTCQNRTYEDLGPTLVGTVSSIRFRFVCMGGRQPFRTRLLSYDGDEVPNLRFTPVITPA